jgi:hypothetical protein
MLPGALLGCEGTMGIVNEFDAEEVDTFRRGLIRKFSVILFEKAQKKNQILAFIGPLKNHVKRFFSNHKPR